MPEDEKADGSWAHLVLLLAISALGMTVWFVVYPVTALLCTLSGIFICLVAIILSETQPNLSNHQTDGRES